jgi:hypothetical protein
MSVAMLRLIITLKMKTIKMINETNEKMQKCKNLKMKKQS